MPLQTLPPELLLEIANVLGANSIYSLVLTCRGLNRLLTPSLYALPLRCCHTARWYGPRALLSAAERRDEYTVRKMLESDILRWFDWQGRRKLDVGLFCAEDSAAIETMLLCGMDPETPFEGDNRPLLSRAAGARNPASVMALLAAPGIRVNAREPPHSGETVLMVAVRNGNVDVVEILCRDARTDVNLRGGSRGRTALHHAVDLRSLTMVRCLLERSEIEVDAESGSGETALCIAAGKGDVDMTKLLLAKAGATVDQAGCVSTTRSLSFVALRSRLKSVRLLAELIEEIGPHSVGSDTPFRHAIRHRHWRVALVLKSAIDNRNEKRGYSRGKPVGGKRFSCFS